jgi:oligopeptidase B
VEERSEAVDRLRILSYDGSSHHVSFPETVFEAHLGDNREFYSETLQLRYQSMVTPPTVFDYHVHERRLETRKVQEIPSGYDPARYATERINAPARDGESIPISIVYRRDFPIDGPHFVHLTGYGAYGYGRPPAFSIAALSLLDRGFAVAIAHVRGGDERGYRWYEDGKLMKRTNTFNDFVDAAQQLIREGWTHAGKICISGGSAGGELMGAVLNMAPELWRAAVAQVPFVDVLNTMLDEALPLTPMEWPEWGNPIESREAFDCIRSYSPYDNVRAQDYPPLLVTAGLSDPRVTYWEPAKWTARLRATKTDENVLLLKTNMGAGHAGKSGRFQHVRETAETYAFFLLAAERAPVR